MGAVKKGSKASVGFIRCLFGTPGQGRRAATGLWQRMHQAHVPRAALRSINAAAAAECRSITAGQHCCLATIAPQQRPGLRKPPPPPPRRPPPAPSRAASSGAGVRRALWHQVKASTP
jgi:hypothetical protein